MHILTTATYSGSRIQPQPQPISPFAHFLFQKPFYFKGIFGVSSDFLFWEFLGGRSTGQLQGGLHLGVLTNGYVLPNSRSHHTHRPAIYGPGAKSHPLPAFVNNICSKHSHFPSLMYYYDTSRVQLQS